MRTTVAWLPKQGPEQQCWHVTQLGWLQRGGGGNAPCTHRQLLEALSALLGLPVDALEVGAGRQHICHQQPVGPKLMHHSAQKAVLLHCPGQDLPAQAAANGGFGALQAHREINGVDAVSQGQMQQPPLHLSRQELHIQNDYCHDSLTTWQAHREDHLPAALRPSQA